MDVLRKHAATASHLLFLTTIFLGLRFAIPDAQAAPGNIDPSFVSHLAQDPDYANVVSLAVRQSDGAILVAFPVTGYPVRNTRLRRLMPDGTLDPGFASAIFDGGAPRLIALDPRGRILVGGAFDHVEGQIRPGIARLQPDGTLDPTFAPVLLDAEIEAIAAEPTGGAVRIGGRFKSVNGTTRHGIARLREDGSLDLGFASGDGVGGDRANYVTALTIEPDARMVIAGVFQQVDGAPRRHIARLLSDGAVDPTFDTGAGPDATVDVIVRYPDGRLLIGGTFNSIAGVQRGRVARLLPNGTVDPEFAPPLGVSPSPAYTAGVSSIAVQANGAILIGGRFDYVNGLSRHALARLLPNGDIDYDWDPAPIEVVTSLALTDDGRLIAAGAIYSGRVDGIFQLQTAADSSAGSFEFASAFSKVGESGGSVELTVHRTSGSTGTATIHYSTSDRTASAPSDYVAGSGILTFAEGTITQTIRIPIVDDRVAEPLLCCSTETDLFSGEYLFGETFNVSLSSPSGGATLGTQATTQVAILDNDTSLEFESADESVLENDGFITLHVVRNGAVNTTNTVNCRTTSGTATAGSDFIPQTATLIFEPGITRRDFRCAIIQDARPESDESFRVDLFAPTGGAVLGPKSKAIVTIRNQPGRAASTLPGAVEQNLFGGIYVSTADFETPNLAVQPDGRILVPMAVGSVNGPNPLTLIRLNDDTTVDESFHARIPEDYAAAVVAIQADGHILASLTPTMGFGKPTLLARLNADGSVEGGFSVAFQGPNGAPGYIRRLIPMQDGRILVAGLFTSVMGLSRTNIVRLNPDGTLDPAFQSPAFTPGNDAYGSADVVMQPDGTLMIWGPFSQIDGVPRNGLARLHPDGTLDTAFAPGDGLRFIVRCAGATTDGKLLVAGGPNNSNESPAGMLLLLRLNPDGTRDPSFLPGVFGNFGTLYGLEVQKDGKIIVGGEFTEAQGVLVQSIARLNADGNFDSTFDPGFGVVGTVNTLLLDGKGRILIRGRFSAVDYTSRPGIARIYGGNPPDAAPRIVTQPTDRSVLEGEDVSWAPVVSGFPLPALQWLRNGEPVAGLTNLSLFLRSATPEQAGVYSLQASNLLGVIISSNATLRVQRTPPHPGRLDLTFRPSESLIHPVRSVVTSVDAIAVQPDGRILLSSSVIRNGNFNTHTLSRIDQHGELDAAFPATETFGGPMHLQPDGRLLVAGGVSRSNAWLTLGMTRLLPDGRVDPEFQPGQGAALTSILTRPNGGIIVIGPFTSFQGQPRPGIAQLTRSGTLDAGFLPARVSGQVGSIQGAVLACALQNDGAVVVAGSFTTINGERHEGMARLLADGTLDSDFNRDIPIDGAITAITVDADGNIVAAGDFANVGGTTRRRLARFDSHGALGMAFDPGPGPDGTISAVALQPGGRVLVVGGFRNVAGKHRPGVARLLADGSLDEGFDPGGGFPSGASLLAVLPEGDILVGGGFTNVDGRPRIGIARILGGPDSGAGRLEFAQARSTVPERDGAGFLTFRRSGGTNGVVSLDYGVAGGSATEGTDYRSIVATIRFEDGDSGEKTVPFTTIDDSYGEGDENVILWLDNPRGGAGLGETAVEELVILEDDTTVEFEAPTYSFNESVLFAELMVRRSGLLSGSTTVHFATSDGTARDGADYLGASGDLTFAPGETNKPLSLLILEDDVSEPDETLQIQLAAAGPETQVGSNSVAYVTILDNDRPGSLDEEFWSEDDFWPFGGQSWPSPGREIRSILSAPDGRIVLAGILGDHGVVRLMPDGSRDMSFIPGGFTPQGYRAVLAASAAALQEDGRLLVCSTDPQGLLRLEDDGQVDASFVPYPGLSTASAVRLQEDGAILLAAEFQDTEGRFEAGVIRLKGDGSLDPTFQVGEGARRNGSPARVTSLLVLPDRRIAAAGDFDQFNGMERHGVALLRPDGSVDPSFDPDPLSGGVPKPENLLVVGAMAYEPGRGILVGAALIDNSASQSNMLIRLSLDGSRDETFSPPDFSSPAGWDAGIRTLWVDGNDQITVGGFFTAVGGYPRAGLARFNAEGSLDEGFSPRLQDVVLVNNPREAFLSPAFITAMSLLPDGDLLAAGRFVFADDQIRMGLARLHGGSSEFVFRSVSRLGNGTVRLRFSEPRGQKWLIQSSTDLKDWADLNAFRPARDTVEFSEVPPSAAAARFYRAKLLP